MPQEVPAADQTEIVKQEDEDDQSDDDTDSTSSEDMWSQTLSKRIYSFKG